MIRHTTPKLKDHHVGFERKDKSYTFMHWEHGSVSTTSKPHSTSKFKWSKYYEVLRELREYSAVGPTILVEWEE